MNYKARSLKITHFIIKLFCLHTYICDGKNPTSINKKRKIKKIKYEIIIFHNIITLAAYLAFSNEISE